MRDIYADQGVVNYLTWNGETSRAGIRWRTSGCNGSIVHVLCMMPPGDKLPETAECNDTFHHGFDRLAIPGGNSYDVAVKGQQRPGVFHQYNRFPDVLSHFRARCGL